MIPGAVIAEEAAWNIAAFACQSAAACMDCTESVFINIQAAAAAPILVRS